MNYIPKFDKDDKEMLVLDTVFALDSCLSYATKHNLNVLFTDTTSSSSMEVLYAFQEKGFTFNLYKERQFSPDGIEITPRLMCKFIYTNKICKILNKKSYI